MGRLRWRGLSKDWTFAQWFSPAMSAFLELFASITAAESKMETVHKQLANVPRRETSPSTRPPTSGLIGGGGSGGSSHPPLLILLHSVFSIFSASDYRFTASLPVLVQNTQNSFSVSFTNLFKHLLTTAAFHTYPFPPTLVPPISASSFPEFFSKQP